MIYDAIWTCSYAKHISINFTHKLFKNRLWVSYILLLQQLMMGDGGEGHSRQNAHAMRMSALLLL